MHWIHLNWKSAIFTADFCITVAAEISILVTELHTSVGLMIDFQDATLSRMDWKVMWEEETALLPPTICAVSKKKHTLNCKSDHPSQALVWCKRTGVRAYLCRVQWKILSHVYPRELGHVADHRLQDWSPVTESSYCIRWDHWVAVLSQKVGGERGWKEAWTLALQCSVCTGGWISM